MAKTNPYAGLSGKRLEALIRAKNDPNLTAGVDYTYGLPQAYSDSEGRNTKVTLTPVNHNRYGSPQDVFYHRLDLAVLGNLPPGYIRPVYIPNYPFSIHDVLPKINHYLGLNLTTDEVENTTYFTEQDTYRLKAVESNSLAWIGSYQFAVHFSWDGIPLEEVVLSTELNGYFYPIAQSQLSSDRVAQLVGLINEANIIVPPLVAGDVTVGLPYAHTGGSTGTLDTRVTITAAEGSRYTDSIEVYFRRIDAAELVGDFNYLTEGPLVLSNLVDFVNQRGQADLLYSEVMPLPVLGLQVGDIVNVDLQIQPDSLRWKGIKSVPVLYGLPFDVDKLHILMNFTLPSPGYIT